MRYQPFDIKGDKGIFLVLERNGILLGKKNFPACLFFKNLIQGLGTSECNGTVRRNGRYRLRSMPWPLNGNRIDFVIPQSNGHNIVYRRQPTTGRNLLIKFFCVTAINRYLSTNTKTVCFITFKFNSDVSFGTVRKVVAIHVSGLIDIVNDKIEIPVVVKIAICSAV
jgi:hypothetical protein